MDDTTSDESVVSTQYLTFTSAGNDFAVPIMRMKEIVPYERSTRIPMTPREIRGLINLRGRAIPVLDLAARFGMIATELSNRTCVLIVDLDHQKENGDMGILADSVSRVIDLGPDEFEATPEFGSSVAPDLILGMAKQGDAFIPILDVERLLEFDDSMGVEMNVPIAGNVAPASPEVADEPNPSAPTE